MKEDEGVNVNTNKVGVIWNYSMSFDLLLTEYFNIK